MKFLIIVLVFLLCLTLFMGCTTQQQGSIGCTTLPQTSERTTIESIDQNIEGITINPINNVKIGDKFSITGMTNLKENSVLFVDVYSKFDPTRNPTIKTTDGEWSAVTGTINVEKGINGAPNFWSFPIDTKTMRPDTYIIKVSAIDNSSDATQTFVLGAAIKDQTALTTPTNVGEIIPEQTVKPSGLNYQSVNIGQEAKLHSTKLGNLDLLIKVSSAEINTKDVVSVKFGVYNIGKTEFNKWSNIRYWFEGGVRTYSLDDFQHFQPLPGLVGESASGYSVTISQYVPKSKAKGTVLHISFNNETEAAWKIT